MSTGVSDLIRLGEYDYMACKAMEQYFPDEFAIRTATYHLQQAIEKMLKAIILFRGGYPPFTHDIERLAENCRKLGETFSDNMDMIADTLTLWESKSRYDPFISFSAAKYEKAKSLYDEIYNKIITQIQPVIGKNEEQFF